MAFAIRINPSRASSSVHPYVLSSRLPHPFLTSIQVVLELKPKPEDPPIEVIASVPPELLPPALQSPDHSDEPKTYVALRQGLHLLTTFHPELTKDDRFHEYFVTQCVMPSLS